MLVFAKIYRGKEGLWVLFHETPLSVGGQRASIWTIHLPYSRSPPQSRNTGQTQDRHKAGERKGGEQTEEEVQLTGQLNTLHKESQSTLAPEWWVWGRMTHFVFIFGAKVSYCHWGSQWSIMAVDQLGNNQQWFQNSSHFHLESFNKRDYNSQSVSFTSKWLQWNTSHTSTTTTTLINRGEQSSPCVLYSLG